MIPQKIHYCWFGGKRKPKLAQKCIVSWKRFCPDYGIIEWNENNVDLEEYPYLKWCYENKKWAFLSDLVRLLVVFKHGGIYLDTDVEVVKSLEPMLEYQAFFGFENNEFINTGIGFGAVSGHISIKRMIDIYAQMKPDNNGAFKMIGCPALNTQALCDLGLQRNGQYQQFSGITILPAEYLNPLDSSTGHLLRTPNTYSIHWYSQSALSPYLVFRSKLTRPIHRIFGEKSLLWLKKLLSR
ncbi:MAG: glycosyltransferase family 32 protein [Victivallales bacterium]